MVHEAVAAGGLEIILRQMRSAMHRRCCHPPAQAPQCAQLRMQDKDDSAVAALAAGGGDAVREAALLESWKAYKRGFQQGIALFNVKPKKGVAFLQARLPGCHPELSASVCASLRLGRPQSCDRVTWESHLSNVHSPCDRERAKSGM